ncbi:hypothetical protein MESS4_20026 [Mesorhizobium sp. STM 4661]|nr:hypothetical protein MESS4_20026 [Mesorhizobium sp. STM 4661]
MNFCEKFPKQPELTRAPSFADNMDRLDNRRNSIRSLNGGFLNCPATMQCTSSRRMRRVFHAGAYSV